MKGILPALHPSSFILSLWLATARSCRLPSRVGGRAGAQSAASDGDGGICRRQFLKAVLVLARPSLSLKPLVQRMRPPLHLILGLACVPALSLFAACQQSAARADAAPR